MKKSNLILKAEDYIKEFIKCSQDFMYFCEKYIFIEIPGGDILINPYQKQKELVKTVYDKKFVMVLKSRQTGISTIIQAYCAWLLIFFDNVVIGILSKDGPEATTFARTIAGMIEKLPKWIKPQGGRMGAGFSKRSEQSFILLNGSKCFSSPVDPKAPYKTLRGKPVTFLVIDEAAFINYLDEAWTSMVPALSTSQKHARAANIPYGTIILSTPNKTMGIGAWYFDQWSDAITGDSLFTPFKIYWKEIPELANDPEWYDTQLKLFKNKEKLEQELELKFLPAGGSFFATSTCEILQQNKYDYKKIKLYGSYAWIFQDPIPGKYYLIGVDTAPEFGSDKSAITIWDYETLEQVWEYQGKLKVQDFVKIIQLVGQQYRGLIVVESNSYGNQVLEELGNDNILSSMLYKEKVTSSIIQTKNNPIKLKYGLSTTSKSRPLMIDALYDYVVKYPEIIKSERLSLELIGLIDKNGRVEAGKGCHDDLALSAAMCFYVRKYDPPLMIDHVNFLSDSFKEIMELNDFIGSDRMGNSEILRKTKEAIFNNDKELQNKLNIDNNVIDIFNFLNQ